MPRSGRRQVPDDGGVELLAREVARRRQRLLPLHVVLVDHAVLDVAVDDALPLLRQVAALALQRLVEPRLHRGEQRPLGEPPVRAEVVERAGRQDELQRGPEDLVQVQVDGVPDAVEVDVLVHVEARVEEGAQRAERALVEREAVGGAEGVVDEPVDVDGAEADAAHARVAAHVVQVVDRDRAGERAVEQADPARDGVRRRRRSGRAARLRRRPPPRAPGRRRATGRRPRRRRTAPTGFAAARPAATPARRR